MSIFGAGEGGAHGDGGRLLAVYSTDDDMMLGDTDSNRSLPSPGPAPASDDAMLGDRTTDAAENASHRDRGVISSSASLMSPSSLALSSLNKELKDCAQSFLR